MSQFANMTEEHEQSDSEKRPAAYPWINARRDALGITDAQIKRALGLGQQNQVFDMLHPKGRGRKMQPGDAEPLGKLLNMGPMDVLFGPRPHVEGVWVKGHIEAGSWREALEWPQDDWYPVDIPKPAEARGTAGGASKIGLEIRGDSLDRYAPDGSVLVFATQHYRPLLRDGAIVAVERTDPAHADIEVTAKRYRQAGSDAWLWPDSTNPEHQPFRFDPATMRILGVMTDAVLSV